MLIRSFWTKHLHIICQMFEAVKNPDSVARPSCKKKLMNEVKSYCMSFYSIKCGGCADSDFTLTVTARFWRILLDQQYNIFPQWRNWSF